MASNLDTRPLDSSSQASRYSLLDALRNRRSRRFGRGMKIGAGPFSYESTMPAKPLTEDEEAALAFAACGLTGYALADLEYGKGRGGQMLGGLLGRTVASADAINCVSVVVTRDDGTYLLKRPQDFAAAEFAELLQLTAQGNLTELYRRSRVKLSDKRAAPPVQPGYNFNINKWSLYAQGGSYFLPINEITAILINALLEAFDEEMALFILDERSNFQPAGVGRFGRSKGGHLNDTDSGRLGTIQAIETSLLEAVSVEQGMILQNIALMAQALGLGGFPNFARHESGWFDALGFRMNQLPASRYLHANFLVAEVLRLTHKDNPVHFPVGLEHNGVTLLKPFCPPYYPSMEAAVHAFVDYKFGPQGIFRGGAAASGWSHPSAVTPQIPAPSEAAIGATIAYCQYVYQRYGRFPCYSPPFRTVLGYQATHVDAAFYDRYYRPEALSETQRMAWTRDGGSSPDAG